jgi:hypothetical protein
MRQLKSVRNNVFGRFTLNQMIVAIIYFAIVTQLLKVVPHVGYTSLFGIMIELAAVVLSLIYFMFFFKEATLYNSIAMIKYGISYAMGDTKADKYTRTAEFIKKKLPIEAVHENGMIEFTKGEWGVLMTQILPHVPDSGRAGFIGRNEDIVNPLPIGIIYKSHRFSSIDTATPLVDQVREAINNPHTTSEMREHLYDSYEQLSETSGKVIWSGWGFIGVGKYKNADAAYSGSKVSVEVIMKSLRDADIIPTRMTSEYEILMAYRQMLSMRRVF